MKKLFQIVIASTVLALAGAAQALESVADLYEYVYKKYDKGGNGGNGGGPTAVPELDAIGAPIALALVAGIGGIAIERRRRKDKKK